MMHAFNGNYGSKPLISIVGNAGAGIRRSDMVRLSLSPSDPLPSFTEFLKASLFARKRLYRLAPIGPRSG